MNLSLPPLDTSGHPDHAFFLLGAAGSLLSLVMAYWRLLPTLAALLLAIQKKKRPFAALMFLLGGGIVGVGIGESIDCSHKALLLIACGAIWPQFVGVWGKLTGFMNKLIKNWPRDDEDGDDGERRA